VESRLNLEKEGAREVLALWTTAAAYEPRRSSRHMAKVVEVAAGQDREALSWRLQVKRKFEAVKFRL